MTSTPLRLPLPDGTHVSAILDAPADAHAALVLAHGAGAGMAHAFMAAVAHGLAARGVAVLRYQFPFIEQGRTRPDAPTVAHATVRAAVAGADREMPGVPLFAGGKSFGSRMTSQAQADEPLERVAGLVFFGFPLHAAKRPATPRADHLSRVAVPMLFLQGTRDDLADLSLLKPIVAGLGSHATLFEIDEADHAFHVRVRSGTNDAAVMDSMLDVTTDWMRSRR